MTHDSMVLFSGGIDSAVCLEQARKRGTTHALIFDYGQPHRIEIEYAEAFAYNRGISYQVHKIALSRSGLLDKDDDSPVVHGRNLTFLSYALSIAKATNTGEVIIGSTAEDQALFPDCRAGFIAAFNRISVLLDGPKVSAPLINMRKSDVLRLAEHLEINLGETWSCYFPIQQGFHTVPCGKCLACSVRKSGDPNDTKTPTEEK